MLTTITIRFLNNIKIRLASVISSINSSWERYFIHHYITCFDVVRLQRILRTSFWRRCRGFDLELILIRIEFCITLEFLFYF